MSKVRASDVVPGDTCHIVMSTSEIMTEFFVGVTSVDEGYYRLVTAIVSIDGHVSIVNYSVTTGIIDPELTLVYSAEGQSEG